MLGFIYYFDFNDSNLPSAFIEVVVKVGAISLT